MIWKGNLEVAEKTKENLVRKGWPVCGAAVPSGKRYSSMVALWEERLRQPQLDDNEDSLNCVNWYTHGAKYWESCNPEVFDMLGGQDNVDGPDREGNEEFLKDLKHSFPTLGSELVADCGGGIGRVTKGVLLDFFDEVVLVDQSPQCITAAPSFIGSHDADRGLQDFIPETQSFDLVWIQWVAGYLTDADLVKFLRRCKSGLKSGGLIVVKDNMFHGFVLESFENKVDGEGEVRGTKEGEKEDAAAAFLLDEEDSSIMRSPPYFLSLAREAGLSVVKERKANEIPEDLHDVYTYVLS